MRVPITGVSHEDDHGNSVGTMGLRHCESVAMVGDRVRVSCVVLLRFHDSQVGCADLAGVAPGLNHH